MLVDCVRQISFCPILQTRYFAIVIACILHLGLRTTIFIHQSKENNTETPTVATYIIYLSMMDLIYSDDLLPCKLRNLPIVIRFFLELVITVWLGEVVLIFFWSNVEKICLSLLIKYMDTDSETREKIHYWTLMVLSMLLSFLVGIETERMEKISSLFEMAQEIRVEREMQAWADKHRNIFYMES
ncbi:hypothetical protein AWZ03_007633 [Drosophila navojoa]|uniref:Uncharacterized protein n=1 Tax=Drosophila navojoa TaxID=7232 RepID=A0A484BAT4_DRONA|nr:uncharacterized protein LOC115562973 [Drosophila navojoa]TDG45913.1 hypothetical protein AWZ03_007633 [Drosophila navojoa]